MFHPDHIHLHHLMLRLGPSRRWIVIIIYSIAAAFCAMALLVASSSSLNLGMFLVVIEVFVVLGIRQLGLKSDAKKMSLEKREAVRKQLNSKGNSKQNVTPIKRAG